MKWKRTTSILAAAAVSAAIGSVAAAACSDSDRPTVPGGVEVGRMSSTSIELRWRNNSRTIGDRTCFDIEVRDRQGKPVGKDVTGESCDEKTASSGRKSRTFTGLNPKKEYCFRVRARSDARREGCVSLAWAGPVCATTDADPVDRKNIACRDYATRAVGAVKYALEAGCDAKATSGPRWSSDFDQHYHWCKTADPKIANLEDNMRNRIVQLCRVQATSPKGGNAQIRAYKSGNRFVFNGSGFAPNVPVIIRLSGPGAATESITVTFHGKQRIVSDAAGRITVVMPYAFVCKPGFARLAVRAEDQDNRKSPVVMTYCPA
jgi:hypothetical protein